MYIYFKKEVRLQVDQVLSFVAHLISADENPAGNQQKRLQALRRLRSLFAGPVRESSDLQHFCPAGCHRSREAVIDDFCGNLIELFLAHPPSPPAANKWTKLYPPVFWFTSFCCLHLLLPGVLSDLCFRLEDMDIDMNVLDLVEGRGDDVAFRIQEQVRVRKTAAFASAESTPDKMCGIAIAIETATMLLGKFFAGASRFQASSSQSMFPLLSTSSPARAVVRSCLGKLQDEQHRCWRALVSAGRPWNERLYSVASVPLWILVGHLWRRFHKSLAIWPWRLGLFVNDELDEAGRLTLADEMYPADGSCEVCLDPFTKWFKSKSATKEVF